MDKKKKFQRYFSLYLIHFVLSFCSFLYLTLPSEGFGKSVEVFSVSDGKGTIHFSWQPSLDFFPDRGWQLLDMESNKIVKSWSAADRPTNIMQINPKKAATTLALIDSIPNLSTDEEKLKVFSLLTIVTKMNFQLAKALGFACSIHSPKGRRSYQLEVLDANQEKVSTLWTSEPIDGSIQTVLPGTPENISATSTKTGVKLLWQVKERKSAPTISHHIERKKGKSWEKLTSTPLLHLDSDPEDAIDYTDRSAPIEERLYYRVRSVDYFGRESLATEISIFHFDHQALKAPEDFVATSSKGKVELSWSKQQNPFTAGYVVERALSSSGIFTPLTKKGLSATITHYKDNDVVGGITYFYRIRAIGPRGDLGTPNTSVWATPQAKSPPPQPKKLRVTEISPIKIKFEWSKPTKPVAGFVVEKRSSKNEKWGQLSDSLRTSHSYEDFFRFGAYGTNYYRVKSIGHNNTYSKPSKEIEVVLPGHPEIPPPYLSDINSSKGVVTLSFESRGNPKLTNKILIVRGNTEDDLGLVIDRPLKGEATSYTDKMVLPEEDYWYALIALDKDGNRSKISNKLLIRVGVPEIPIAKKPNCSFLAKPFRHVQVSFEKPADSFQVTIMRKTQDEDRWTTIADNVQNVGKIIDANPPQKGTVSYALLYKTERGRLGPLSKSETLEITR